MKNLILMSLFALPLAANAELPGNYQGLLATEKLSILWGQLVPNEYVSLPTKAASNLLDATNPSFVAESFNLTSDELPSDRVHEKPFHTYGTAAQVEFRVTQKTKYTGIFESGAIGLARMSLANQGPVYTPGMGLKFLVDGKPSQNLQVMYSLNGQGDNQNFFANDFSNIIPEPKGILLKAGASVFKLAIRFFIGGYVEAPNRLPLYHIAKVKADGTEVAEPIFPYQITFHSPNKSGLFDNDKTDMRTKMKELENEQVLYDVFASDRDQGAEVLIGKLILKSRFIASPYGDKALFFQHGVIPMEFCRSHQDACP